MLWHAGPRITRRETYRAESSLREDDSDDHTVKSQRLTEDENKDHADEDLLLLSVSSDTCITDNTNSETSSEGGETASQTGGEMFVTIAISIGVDIRLNYNNEGKWIRKPIK